VDPRSRFASEGIGERCTLVAADLCDHAALARALDEHGVKSVYHLASHSIVEAANRSPFPTWEANVRGTYSLLEACRVSGGVERIVVASSERAYGEQEELPFREDFALRPSFPYAVSKACTDMIARSYASTYGVPLAVTRLANVYGPGDVNWSRLVPNTARALARGERPVLRSDGSPERDFLYVDDAAAVYLAAGASLDRHELRGRAWNAGGGEPVPVREVVSRLTAIAGSRAEPEVQGTKAPGGDVDRRVLDSTAIREKLGWAPEWDLERGLRAAWEWYARALAS
jgi:CDP-glucose 4,6-dehydratase